MLNKMTNNRHNLKAFSSVLRTSSLLKRNLAISVIFILSTYSAFQYVMLGYCGRMVEALVVTMIIITVARDMWRAWGR
jgi:hypothetical protein